MALTQFEAWLYLPFVWPLCFYTAFTDLREMRITNQTVMALGLLFLPLGLIALPFDTFLWRLVQLLVVLAAGVALNFAGGVGAGDAKFAAAAAPYIALGDLQMVMVIFAACLLAAVVTHRAIKRTPLREMAPHWESWTRGRDFPMGLALGGTLAIYLGIAALMGT